jgi:hypothetical protein
MRFPCLIALLSFAIGMPAHAQGGQNSAPAAAAAQSSAAPPPANAAANIAPDAPVITLVGLCDQGLINGGAKTAAGVTPVAPSEAASGPAFGPDCKSVITREQFETLFNAVDATRSEGHRWRMANQFPDMLIFAEKGRESAYDRKPNFQERAKYNFLQTLGQFTLGQMQDEISQASDSDIEKYYNEHKQRFEEITLYQISLPKERKHRPAGSKPGTPDVGMARIAQSIRREAVAGGKFDVLEDKGYVMAGYSKDESPDTDLGEHWTVDNLPKEYASMILSLKPGQVSQLIDAPDEFLIFKLVKKKMVPPERVRQMYVGILMRDATQALRNSVKVQLDESYFQKPKPEPPALQK